jgi:hypothetical protein
MADEQFQFAQPAPSASAIIWDVAAHTEYVSHWLHRPTCHGIATASELETILNIFEKLKKRAAELDQAANN